jgi:hypothetical protein
VNPSSNPRLFCLVHWTIFLHSISPDFWEGGSEQISEGAQISQKPPTNNVERFLSILRLDSREKVNILAVP